MSNSPFTVVSKVSIRPSKIVFYEQFFRNVPDPVVVVPPPSVSHSPSKQLIANLYENEIISRQTAPIQSLPSSEQPPKKQVQPNKHGFEISQKASANIKEKISWLYSLAKRRVKILPSSQGAFYFKMNFITLSLPAQQFHTSAEITAKCLDGFLQECKRRYGLENYVWRLEFQKNGNVHYHLASDCFLPYDYTVAIWNRELEKLGYIDKYCEKFSKMGFKEYYNNYSQGLKNPMATLKRRYRKGVKNGWRNPKTVDVKSVDNDVNIAFYIAKYITKKSDTALNSVVAAREDATSNLRLWFCSRSLSRLKKIVYFLDYTDNLVDEFYSNLTTTVTKIFDYCRIVYYDHVKQSNAFKRSAWSLFSRYASENDYKPSL